MNRLATAALLLSLAANALLGALAWTRAPRSTAKPAAATSIPLAPAAKTSTRPETPEAQHRVLRDQLRVLGFTDDDVRKALRAEIEAPRQTRARELRLAKRNAPSFWARTWGFAAGFAPAEREQLEQMRHTEREEMIRLFGPDAMVESGAFYTLAFLPAEKARRVATINQDYNDLKRELTENRDNTNLTAVREREKMLAAERERDLAAILTPEERQMLEMRDSDTAARLRRRWDAFGGSDDEFRTIFAQQKAYDDRHVGAIQNLGPAPSLTPEQQQTNAAVRDALGPERFATWLRSQRTEYQALVEVRQRFSLPPATFDAVARLPDETNEAAVTIANDPSLDSAQKSAALKELSNRAREEIRTLLGGDVGDAYNAASERSWLGYLDRGQVVTYRPDGTMSFLNTNPRSPPLPRKGP